MEEQKKQVIDSSKQPADQDHEEDGSEEEEEEQSQSQSQTQKNPNPKRKGKFHALRDQIDQKTQDRWNNEQKFLKKLIIEKDLFKWNLDKNSDKCLKYIGGVDISFSKDDPNIACSFLVVLKYPELKPVYEDYEYVKLDMPYVPGFLAFREASHLLKLFNKLKNDPSKSQFYPEVVLADGNGILHNNGCGIASHLGVHLGIPTIGCGKTVFFVDGLRKDIVFNKFRTTVKKGGDFVELVGESGRVWGAALKSNDECIDPIIVSLGTQISLKTALQIVIQCCKHRVPEPVRVADLRSRALMKKITPEQAKNVVTNVLPFLSEVNYKSEEQDVDDIF